LTAEIAILNRSALALAADSAVTISVGGKTKVYDSAEKLFELTKLQPIALMIYNNVEFVGVPLDVLIRKFRNEHDKSGKIYDSIKVSCDHFLDYLKSFEHDVLEEQKYLFTVLSDHFQMLEKKSTSQVIAALKAWFENPDGDRPSAEAIFEKLVMKEIEIERARPLEGFLTKVKVSEFRERYEDVIKHAAISNFSVEIGSKLLTLLIRYAFAIVRSANGSDLLTGLVFGGFAKDDIFPTLRYLEIDGVFFDELKILSCNEIDIDRNSVRAEVVPFAQKEMVERFMYGLDSGLQSEVAAFVNNLIDQVVEGIDSPDTPKLVDKVKSKVSENFSDLLKRLKDSSRQDLLDVVYFMSKKELADIAYALVELTSQKRRFSTEEETVGGPIDVAILTQNEGFVWIRRKHYFSPDLNGGYLGRSSLTNGDIRNDGNHEG